MISELSHKPYPAGRATHGGIEGIMALREQHAFKVDDVKSVRVIGPPLIKRLCGRPPVPAPHAKLCAAVYAIRWRESSAARQARSRALHTMRN